MKDRINEWMLRLGQLNKEEEGQDLIEYTLLLAFVTLASAALFISAGSSVNAIWNAANGLLNSAAAAIPTF